MSSPYTYPVHCALCQEVIPGMELHDGEALEDEDGEWFCNETCKDMFQEQEEEE